MNRRLFFISFAVALASLLISFKSSAETAKGTLGQTPLYFTENKGQWDEHVLFKADGGAGLTWWFERDGLTLAVFVPDTADSGTGDFSRRLERATEDARTVSQVPRKGHALKLRFVPSKSQSSDLVFVTDKNVYPPQEIEVIPDGKLGWNNNYFLGNDSSKWAPDCGNFTRLTYRNVWEGIDVVYYGQGDQLKYDYVVKPGADPSNVRLRWLGLEESLRLDGDADGKVLTLATSVGALKEAIPLAYQRGEDGSRIPVEVSMRVLSENEFGLEVVGTWDRSKELVVDPLVYSTYLGGRRDESITELAPDGAGGVFAAGITYSDVFPVTEGALDSLFNGGETDAFITRSNSNGSELIFCTYLGGEGIEIARTVEFDGEEGVFVAGASQSPDFPVTDNAYDHSLNGRGDAFICRINGEGNELIYSTFLGGSSGEEVHALFVFGGGSVIVAGGTSSGDFPTTAEAFDTSYNFLDYNYSDVFVASLSWDGRELIYSTYLGGFAHDYARSLTSDGEGGVFVVGVTRSPEFPTTDGAFDRTFNGENDAFVARLSEDGSDLIFSSYLGGSLRDEANGVASDGAGGVVLAGSTECDDFPTTEGSFDISHNGNFDTFIARLSGNRGELIYSSFLGGEGFDFANALVADGDGGVVVSGSTNSRAFPATVGAYNRWLTGSEFDAFLTRLNSDGSELLYSTYFGFAGWDQAYALTLDTIGGTFIAGTTTGDGFPVTGEAFDRTFNGGETDCFIAKFDSIALNVDEAHIRHAIPSIHFLSDAFPNPFNSTTMIRFGIPVAGEVELAVWDLSGKKVADLLTGWQPVLPAGYYEAVWNAAGVPAGVYLVKLQTKAEKLSRKVTLVR